jgi:hypothetical protein
MSNPSASSTDTSKDRFDHNNSITSQATVSSELPKSNSVQTKVTTSRSGRVIKPVDRLTYYS